MDNNVYKTNSKVQKDNNNVQNKDSNVQVCALEIVKLCVKVMQQLEDLKPNCKVGLKSHRRELNISEMDLSVWDCALNAYGKRVWA
jgi:hypothetical protein